MTDKTTTPQQWLDAQDWLSDIWAEVQSQAVQGSVAVPFKRHWLYFLRHQSVKAVEVYLLRRLPEYAGESPSSYLACRTITGLKR